MQSGQETLLIVCCLTVAILCVNLGWSASLLVIATCAVITLLGTEHVKYRFHNTFMTGPSAFAMRSKEDEGDDGYHEGQRFRNPRIAAAKDAERDEIKKEEIKKEEGRGDEKEEPHRGLKHFQQGELQWEAVRRDYSQVHYRSPTNEERLNLFKSEADFLVLGNNYR